MTKFERRVLILLSTIVALLVLIAGCGIYLAVHQANAPLPSTSSCEAKTPTIIIVPAPPSSHNVSAHVKHVKAKHKRALKHPCSCLAEKAAIKSPMPPAAMPKTDTSSPVAVLPPTEQPKPTEAAIAPSPKMSVEAIPLLVAKKVVARVDWPPVSLPSPEVSRVPIIGAQSEWADCRVSPIQPPLQATCQPTREQVQSFLNLGKTEVTPEQVMADAGLKDLVCQFIGAGAKK